MLEALRRYSLLWLFTLGHLAYAQDIVITMGSDEWFPYAGNPQQRGYMLEVADRVFAKHGIRIDYQLTPWVRVVQGVKTGKINAAPGMRKADAPDFIYPEEPLGQDTQSFFVLQENPWTYEGLDSLRDKSLGVIKDYLYEKTLDVYIQEHLHNPKRIQVIHGNDPLKLNINKLLAKRFDILAENPQVFRYKLKLMGVSASRFREMPVPREIQWLYIGFSPALAESQHYAKLLSEGIRELRQRGELAPMLSKYGVSDWK